VGEVSSKGGVTPRAQPFYCPYCGEQDFVPYGEEPNRYLCSSCERHYSVTFLGLDAGAGREVTS
jgi:DNA-directed RNA polymerase subunit RPC12/RpoP